MNRLLAGALAGGVGTYAMTMAKRCLFPKLPPAERYPLPPREITQDVVERVAGREVADEELLLDATLASHFAYGAASGAVFAMLGLHEKHPVANGVAFGVAVWAVSYLGWLPAAGILTPATRHPPARNALMIAVHVVWGGVTGDAVARLLRSAELYGQAGADRLYDRAGRPAPERLLDEDDRFKRASRTP